MLTADRRTYYHGCRQVGGNGTTRRRRAGLLDPYETFLQDAYHVVTANNGDEAFELVDESVDVVMLDRRMPDTSGDEVLATLRERGYDVPVGMKTAVDPDVDIVDMPFDDYLTKPIDREELRDTVGLLVARASFDEKSREFFRLASKKAALETEGPIVESGSEEYRELGERMETLRAELDEALEEVIDRNPKEAFRSL